MWSLLLKEKLIALLDHLLLVSVYVSLRYPQDNYLAKRNRKQKSRVKKMPNHQKDKDLTSKQNRETILGN